MGVIFLGFILLLVSFPANLFKVPRQATGSMEIVVDFPERWNSVIIENTAGAVEVQTWQSSSVRITASRKTDKPISIGSDLVFEKRAADVMRIVASPASVDEAVDLLVYVPSTVHLAVRGGNRAVTIRGFMNGLSAESDSGAVALYLPKDSNADLSLRSVEGSVQYEVPLAVFGRADAKSVDGRMGAGGYALIARSLRGRISLLADDPSRMAKIKDQPQDNSAPGPGESASTAQRSSSKNGIGRDGLGKTLSRLRDEFGGNSLREEAGPEEARPVITPVAAPKPAEEAAIKLEARLVNLNVKVADASGRIIPSLKKEDFVVFEDGSEQEITYFEPINAPVSVVLLLDLSGSVRDKMKVMKKAAKKFIDSLGPKDRIAVAAFSGRFMVVSGFTSDRNLLKDRIDDIKNRNSGTRFYDAMCSTLDLFNEISETRKAIVVLTDGVDSSIPNPDYTTKYSFDDMLSRIIQEEATIYPIYLDTEYEMVVKRGQDNHEAYVTARKQLQEISDQTGTQVFKANRFEDLEGVYQRVAAELHTLYSIGYMPKVTQKENRWRSISVKVNQAGATARTKRGYYVR